MCRNLFLKHEIMNTPTTADAREFINQQNYEEDVKDSSIKSAYDFVIRELENEAHVAEIKLLDTKESIVMIPVLSSKTEAYEKCLNLKFMIESSLDFFLKANEIPSVISLHVPRYTVEALLPTQKNENDSALILLLPHELEPFLFDALLQTPTFIQAQSTDLTRVFSYFELRFGQEKCVWIDEEKFELMMFNLSLFYKKNMDSNHPQNANLIMIAGKTVAVGGFYLTQEYIDNAQISSYFATNHRPYRYFDQTELDEAALKSEKIGNTPWQNSWFKFKSDLSVIAPKYLSYEML